VSDSLFQITDATAANPAGSRAFARRAAPNPSTSSVSFEFGLPHDASARLAIMSVQGREIAVVVNGRQSSDGTEHLVRRHDVRARGAGCISPS
jgi:hypothetical protein